MPSNAEIIARIQQKQKLLAEKRRKEQQTGVMDFAGEDSPISGESLPPNQVPDPFDPTNEASLTMKAAPTLDEVALRALGKLASPTGLPVKQRFDMSMLSSNQGEREYLADTKTMLLEVPSDEAISGYKKIVSGDNGQTWHDVDPIPGKNFLKDLPGDVADLSDEALRIGTGMGAAYLTGGASIPIQLLAGLAGDVAGEAIQQGYGASLPGDEGLTMEDRLKRGAVNVGAGLGINGLFAGLNALRPSVRLGSRVLDEMVYDPLTKTSRPAREVLEERLVLEGKTGVELTPSQLTGSQELADLEKSSKAAAPALKEKAAAQVTNASSAVDSALAKVAPSSDNAGREVTEDLVSKNKELRADRAKATDPLYDKVVQTEAPIPGVVADKIGNLRKSYGDTPQLVKLEAELQGDITPARLNVLLKDWTAKAKSKNAIDDLSPDASRSLAGDVKAALQEQLDWAKGLQSPAGEAAQTLEKARETTFEMSQPLKETSDKNLTNLLKKHPDDVPAVASRWAAGEMGQSLKVLEKVSPKAAPKMRRAMAEKLIDTKDLASLERSLTNNEDKLKVILGENEGLADLRKIIDLNRNAPKGTSEGVAGQLFGRLAEVFRAFDTKNPMKISSSIYKLASMPADQRIIVKMVQDREFMKTVLRLSKSNKLTRKKAAALGAKLIARWGVIAADDELEDYEDRTE